MAAAAGILRVAHANIVRGIRVVSVERGHDPRLCTLVPFGGAGPMHGSPVARELRIGRIAIPPAPGILCALGQLLSNLRHDLIETHIFPYSTDAQARAAAIARRLVEAADRLLEADRVPREKRAVEVRVEARYVGQSYELPIAFDHGDAGAWARLGDAFHAAHRARFGHADPAAPIEIVGFGATAIGRVEAPELPVLAAGDRDPPAQAQIGTRRVFFEGAGLGDAGAWTTAQVLARDKLLAGNRIAGPAIIEEISATTVLYPGDRARDACQRRADRGVSVMTTHKRTFDPITLEVLRNALEATAQEMGATLKLTSFSPNIKERMDASCAIFDAEAQLVAQAEHVPVHLGSMLKAVGAHRRRGRRARCRRRRHCQRPLRRRRASARHHADRAGARGRHADRLRGDARASFRRRRHGARLHAGQVERDLPGGHRDPAGAALPAGELQADVLRLILANVRTAAERRGDLNAQLAALRIGERRLEELAERYGTRMLVDGFDAILDYAERRMRRKHRRAAAGQLPRAGLPR